MELLKLSAKNNQFGYNSQSISNINKQINTKLNTPDITLTLILYVATLYFNRILHLQIKARL